MARGAVHFGVAEHGALVGERVLISEAHQRKTASNLRDLTTVARQPGDRADRPRGKEESDGVAQGSFCQALRQLYRHRDSREIVVRERGVTYMGRDEQLVVALPGHHVLRVGECARLEGGVDEDLVLRVLHPLELLVGKAEAPVLRVVARPVGNPVRTVGHGVQVSLELLHGDAATDGGAVVHHVKVRRLEIDDLVPLHVPNPRVADVPLRGHAPVEHPGTACDLVYRQGEHFVDERQAHAHAVTRNASTDGVETPDELLHGRAAHDSSPTKSRRSRSG
jgi:hypothetical protein